MDNRIIYLCENTPEGVFTAIYDAWASGLHQECLSIQAEQFHEMQLFTEYVHVKTDFEKAEKVARSVKRKIGWEAYRMMYETALSHETDKMDAIYRFLKLGFQYGRRVTDMHGEEVVCRVFELARNVGNEAHFFREFLRFQDSEEGILIARIHPKNQVLPFLGEHFSDRFPEEDFVILDKNHEMGLFHEKRKLWYLVKLEEPELEEIWEHSQLAEYAALWKTFFRTIAIEERKNEKCQRTLCPLRYRHDMIEFHA